MLGDCHPARASPAFIVEALIAHNLLAKVTKPVHEIFATSGFRTNSAPTTTQVRWDETVCGI